jgi:hypothetical protein
MQDVPHISQVVLLHHDCQSELHPAVALCHTCKQKWNDNVNHIKKVNRPHGKPDGYQ